MQLVRKNVYGMKSFVGKMFNGVCHVRDTC